MPCLLCKPAENKLTQQTHSILTTNIKMKINLQNASAWAGHVHMCGPIKPFKEKLKSSCFLCPHVIPQNGILAEQFHQMPSEGHPS